MKSIFHCVLIILMGIAFARTTSGDDRMSLAERFFSERMEVSIRQEGHDAVLSWSIFGEAGWVGFNVVRSSDSEPEFITINSDFLANSFALGGSFEYRDSPLGDVHYMYAVDVVFTDGSRFRSKPVALEFKANAVPREKATLRSRFSATSDEEPHLLSKPAIPPTLEVQKLKGRGSVGVSDRVKIVVKEEGVYRLGTEELADKFGASVEDVKTWIAQDFLRLSSQGVKCCWVPDVDHEGLYFYNPGYETLYTVNNVFWLERESLGLVLPAVQGDPPAEAFAPTSFVHTVFFEEQKRQEFTRFYPALDDYWFWLLMQAGNPASNVVFDVDRIAEAGPDAELELHLQGGSNSGVSNEHHVVVSINGTEVGHARWEKNVPVTNLFTVPVSILTNGANTLTLRAVLNAGISYSSVYLDRFSLSVRMRAEAENDYLRLPSDGTTEWRASGFTNSDIRVVEIVDTHRIRPAEAVRVEAEGGGAFSAHFVATTNENIGYAVLSPQGARVPSRVEGVPASWLRATTNRVDYLLLTHPILEAQIQRLADFRVSQNPDLQARVVLMDDIYNEFSFGIETPEAIQRFLAYVYDHWQQRPEYVLFGGEGSFDYKNYFETFENLVPCLRVDTPYGLFSSDNALADVAENDGVPEYSIGRIPASSAMAMSNVVDKIIAHEASVNRPEIALLVADNPDDAGDFWSTADTTTNLLPASYFLNKAYLQAASANLTATKNTVKSGINSGAPLLLYFGHSSWNRIAGEGILRIDELGSLTNTPHLATAVLMTCVPNRYEFPQYDYFGEALMLLPRHGAIASWGPSGESLNAFASTYCFYFLEERISHPDNRLGDFSRRATERAHQVGMVRFMLDIMTLLGDPLTSAY